MNKIQDSRILVTGADSMIGRATLKTISNKGGYGYGVPHTQVFDLENLDKTLAIFEQIRPTYCIHLAGFNGNIPFSSKYPSEIFEKTTRIGLNVLRACNQFNVEKVVSILSSCAITDLGGEELSENHLWVGPPNKSIEAHGLAKRNIEAYSRFLSKQFGLRAVCCILQNSFGPHDSTDINKTKVVMGLIKKFVDAKNNGDSEVVCWGTGRPKREFLYCDDAAEGIIQTLERYHNTSEPINITSKNEMSIKSLAETIKRVVGFKGDIVFDTSKPDGQMRKVLYSDKMDQELDMTFTKFEKALKHTIEWYENL